MKPYELRSLPFFQRDLERICELFPKSAAAIRAVVESLPDNPDAGDIYPNLKTILTVRKQRIALKAYKLGKSDGLRLIFAVREEKRRILPLCLYSKKGEYAGERKVIALIKDRLKITLSEL